MPTTLWFSKEEKEQRMLDKLIIAGQMTICNKLMEFLDKKKTSPKYEEYYENHLEKIDALHVILIEYWKQFNENPYWLTGEFVEKIE